MREQQTLKNMPNQSRVTDMYMIDAGLWEKCRIIDEFVFFIEGLKIQDVKRKGVFYAKMPTKGNTWH